MKMFLKYFLAGVFLLLASTSFAQDDNSPIVEAPDGYSPFVEVSEDTLVISDNTEVRQLTVTNSNPPAENELDQMTMEVILMSLEESPGEVTDRTALNGFEIDSVTNELADFRELIRDRITQSIAYMCEAYNDGASGKEAWLIYDNAYAARANDLRDQAFSRMEAIDSLLVSDESKDGFASLYAETRDRLSKSSTPPSHSQWQEALGIDQENSAKYHCNR